MNTPQKTKKSFTKSVPLKDDDMDKQKSKPFNLYGHSTNGIGSSANTYEETPVGMSKNTKHGYDNPMDSCRRALFFDDGRPQPK